MRYTHPWILNKEGSLWKCDHVTDDKGTGIVHLAPGHGHEDFLEALRYKLPVNIQKNIFYFSIKLKIINTAVIKLKIVL